MNLTLDYIAGLFDGEGSIIVRAKKDNRYKAGYQLVVKIALHQKEKYILEMIKDTLALDAHLYYHRRDKLWYLEIHKISEIERFVQLIGPRSIIKKIKFNRLKIILEMIHLKLHLTREGIMRILAVWRAPATAANPR